MECKPGTPPPPPPPPTGFPQYVPPPPSLCFGLPALSTSPTTRDSQAQTAMSTAAPGRKISRAV
ncbi:hypothetical protein EXN66_Car012153 [Channa argus]|uniref:Uncharacterized protein n=1 Tax=Channa argus TaxID=215402 RepID=A0A6G1Q1S3_CHAAH|nr:hypothetical protein EXN66_Car012153 [Channa argus]